MVSILLNMKHLNRMNLKYKKMNKLVSCKVAKPLIVLNQTAHRFHVATSRRIYVDIGSDKASMCNVHEDFLNGKPATHLGTVPHSLQERTHFTDFDAMPCDNFCVQIGYAGYTL